MKVFDSILPLETIEKGLVLTIGNFDGVHLGHQEIMKTARAACERFDTQGLAVMTFDPHPKVILHPEKTPGVLTSLEIKRGLLKQYGASHMIVLRDGFKLLNLTPVEFVDEFLMKIIRPAVVVEGPDFNFGRGRSGDVWTLKELGRKRGFEVVVTEPKRLRLADEQPIVCSSSLVRNLLTSGRVESAAEVLGRAYRLVGRVVTGSAKELKPTFAMADVEPCEQIVPATGLYAGLVEIGNSFELACMPSKRLPAVFNITDVKTLAAEQKPLIETHILETDVVDLPGKWLVMDFVKHIRPHRTFDGERELVRQIAKDCEGAKNMLAVT